MRVNVLGVGTLGPLLLSVAHRQGLFRKLDLDVQIIRVPGARVPTLTTSNSLGHIGAPAAIMQVAQGTDLKILASFDASRLSGCLVVNPEIRAPKQLRGKRLGIRVTGAAIWIQTVLALKHLGLAPEADRIDFVQIGDAADIAGALESGQIDGAVLTRAHCEKLTRKGYATLLDLSPLYICGVPDAFVVTAAFLRDHPDAAEAMVAGLIEGAAFVQSPRKRTVVMEFIRSEWTISDSVAATSALVGLLKSIARKPYPSIERLADMQSIMSMNKPNLLDVAVGRLIDSRFVCKFEENRFIERTYASYEVV